MGRYFMKRVYPLIAVLALIGSTLACSVGLGTARNNNPSTPGNNNPTEPSQLPTVAALPAPTLMPLPQPTLSDSAVQLPPSSQNDLVSLYQRVSPGVVSISVSTDQGNALGSGFVYDGQGHVVTNYHVIEGASDLEVDFPSGFKAHGKVVGTDLDSDVAVIKVDNVPADQLHPLPLGDSSKLQVGQTVIAIGNPFGLAGTMTTGIVSAMGRTLESMRQTPGGQLFSAGDLIQTDAAINPGNSGGPLLNTAGEVIGINRAIRTNNSIAGGEPSNSGIGFAVSINIVKRVVPVLLESGQYDYPYLGITSQEELTLADQEALGLPQATGAYVTEVVPGGPADKAGMRGGTNPTDVQGLNAGGDLIIAVDGRPVRVFGDLLSYLMNNKSPGEQVVLTILRDNQQKEVTLTLEKRP